MTTQTIRLHGRGGQGTVTAAELLAVAAFYDGKEAQAFPNFGVERRGAPVIAYCRISDQPIRIREHIYEPDYIIVQDSTLIETTPEVLEGTKKSQGILINTERTKWSQIKIKRIVAIPALKIALEKIGKPFINTALLGAFVAMSNLISLESLKRAITERFAGESAETNAAAAEAAYQLIKKN